MEEKIQEIKDKTKNWLIQNLANLITMLGFVFSFFFLITAISEPKKILKIIIFAVIAGITDLIDGPTARKLKTETIIGSYMDRIRDRVFIYPGMIILAIQHRDKLIHPELFWGLVIFLFVLESLIFRIGFWGLWHYMKGVDLKLHVNDWGKRKIFTGFVVIFIWIGSLWFESMDLPILKYSIWLIYFGLALMAYWAYVSWKEYQDRERKERAKKIKKNEKAQIE